MCFKLIDYFLDAVYSECSQISKQDGHIALVVCPLRSLMKDQVKRWESKTSCVALLKRKEMTQEEIDGKLSFKLLSYVYIKFHKHFFNMSCIMYTKKKYIICLVFLIQGSHREPTN